MIETNVRAGEVERPRFRERQVLDGADLAAEQEYLLSMARRHRVGGHAWGIAAGLGLVASADAVVVGPGVAVDGYGRELVLAAPAAVGGHAVDAVGGKADVWILYGRPAETPRPRGRGVCGPDRHPRWREQPCLRLTRAREMVVPATPPGVPAAALDFRAHAHPPDDPATLWPVYLGTVDRDASGELEVRRLGRRYGGLVGEEVRHPLRRPRFRLGGEPAQAAFAVEIPDQEGSSIEPLSIDRRGRTRLRGDAFVSGPLRVGDETTGLPVATMRWTPLVSAPTEAAPWRMYRVTVDEGARTVRQLRVEIGSPGEKGDPARYALSIGHTDATGDFVRSLTVTAAGDVIVDGKVAVQGVLVPSPVDVNPNDPRFDGAVVERWLHGVSGAGERLDATYAASLGLESISVSSDSSGAVWWSWVVRNEGALPLSDVRTSVTIGAGAVLLHEDLGGPFTIEPGAGVDVIGTFTVAQVPALATVVLVASGVAADGGRARARAVRLATFPASIN